MYHFLIGMDEEHKPHVALNDALQDDKRISFHRDYLSNLSAAIRYTRKSLFICLTHFAIFSLERMITIQINCSGKTSVMFEDTSYGLC